MIVTCVVVCLFFVFLLFQRGSYIVSLATIAAKVTIVFQIALSSMRLPNFYSDNDLKQKNVHSDN